MQVKVRGQARGSNQLGPKFGSRFGARTSYGKSSDLHAGLELDHLNSTGIENRVICRAIGLQFVGCLSDE